jgi:hypothetical protein
LDNPVLLEVKRLVAAAPELGPHLAGRSKRHARIWNKRIFLNAARKAAPRKGQRTPSRRRVMAAIHRPRTECVYEFIGVFNF